MISRYIFKDWKKERQFSTNFAKSSERASVEEK